MTKSPIVRSLLAVAKDARAALVALAVVAVVVGGVALLHHHVRVRAWIAIVIVGAFLLALLILDMMRAHERDQATRLRGVESAERLVAEARSEAAEPQPNAQAQDLIRSVESLRSTIRNRVSGYVSTTGLGARQEEVHRYNLLSGRVFDLIHPPDELGMLLRKLPAEPGVEHDVDRLLSGLDLMENEVMIWGLNHPDHG
jgi:hypothetical protein